MRLPCSRLLRRKNHSITGLCRAQSQHQLRMRLERDGRSSLAAAIGLRSPISSPFGFSGLAHLVKIPSGT